MTGSAPDLAVEGPEANEDGPTAGADTVTINFVQTINNTDPLRSGQYAKTLTFTLSTTNP